MFAPLRRLAPAFFAAATAAISHAAEIAPTAPAKTGLKGPERTGAPLTRPASDEPARAAKLFKVPDGFTVDLFAAEPMLGNPVAICLDNQGRLFVSETYRYRSSTLDIRHYMFMLEDDLASRTVEDRVAYMKKNFPGEWQKLGIESEVIRLVEDRDGDGQADFSAIYADGFTSLLDGIASGVLAHGGSVWFTNMPSLWKLDGIDKNGHAEKREEISRGYGVRFSFTGHDMHGLILAPDGRLYFSFGDRGANVTTKEGVQLAFPDEGAVFRCEPDGTRMEVFCRGLRNPQELAFDNHGNLFTGDNDSDQGDRERWEYLVPGADYGWRVGWQHHPLGKEHNPWLAERLWEPYFPGQAAYIIPPIANIPDGPSGLAFYPGTGLEARYNDHFFQCGFKGTSARSSISAWESQRIGAGFRLNNEHIFLGGVQATDITFGPDSKMYFSEWGEGWEGTARGRVFRIYDKIASQQPAVEEVKKLLAAGFKGILAHELTPLLRHADQRIRLEAQWELASRPEAEREFVNTASSPTDFPEPQLARLHAIWGLGSVARRAEYKAPGAAAKLLAPLIKLLEDEDEEVRGQVAKVLGENSVAAAYDGLMRTLRDTKERVSFFSAMALGQLGRKECIPQVLLMVRENEGRDPFLRHAYVMALAGTQDVPALLAAGTDANAHIRMAALLALRRLKRPEIALFLADEDPLLVMEAARAIYEVPIAPALPKLAALLAKPTADKQLMFRVLGANFRTGTPAAAQALAEFAAKDGATDVLRAEALKLLALWPQPPARDRMTGLFNPLPARAPEPAATALHAVLTPLLGAKSEPLLLATLNAAAALQLKADGAALVALIGQKDASSKVRKSALETLAALGDPKLADAIQLTLADPDPALRIAASAMLAKLDPAKAAEQLAAVFFGKVALPEKKAVILALGGITGPAADRVLGALLEDLRAGKIPAEVQVELLEVASARPAPELKTLLATYQNALPKNNPLAAFAPTLTGGDRAAGETVFREHAVAACLRCHKLKGSGGEAGPDLTGIGAKRDRAFFLEAILQPNATIAEGFQTVVVTLKNGDIQAGLLKSETAAELVLQMPGTPAITVKKADIAARDAAPSGMSANFGDLLTKREIRDLVEFMASLKD